MVKLLEFNPDGTKETIKSDAFSLLEEDLWMGLTPDLPDLRYGGDIPVFLWDELAAWRGLESRGFDSKDFEVQHQVVYTVDKLLPFYQRVKSNGSVMRNVLPSSPTWNKSVKDQPLNLLPREVRGKIITTNIFGIRLLDTLYNNTITHFRRKTRFTTPSGKETVAWIYSMPTNVFTKYDPHENTYNLVSGFNPASCNIVKTREGSSMGSFAFKLDTGE